jgi:hypothetical protein
VLSDLEYGGGLLVLLGAGASFDSIRVKQPGVKPPNRPPLTKDLAGGGDLQNRLASKYRDAHAILNELREKSAPLDGTNGQIESFSLEEALAEYLKRTDDNVPRHIAALRFYLRDLLWESANSVLDFAGGLTNYTGLVSRAYQWAHTNNAYASFVSFNYDHLLETACQNHFNFDPTNPNAYTNHQLIPILKPHGSVLWSWRYPATYEFRHGQHPISEAIATGEPDSLEELSLAMKTPPLDLSIGVYS